MDTITQTLGRARDWLDERGKPAWIIAMVLGFIMFWPLGLGILFYMIGRKKMDCSNWKNRRSSRRSASTGNSAFDAYREETMKRLEEERDSFVSFLDELRSAKDRAEFDQFMTSRRTPDVA